MDDEIKKSKSRNEKNYGLKNGNKIMNGKLKKKIDY